MVAVVVQVAEAVLVGVLVSVGKIVAVFVTVALGVGVLVWVLVALGTMVCVGGDVGIGVARLRVSSNMLSKHRPEKYSSLSTSENNLSVSIST